MFVWIWFSCGKKVIKLYWPLFSFKFVSALVGVVLLVEKGGFLHVLGALESKNILAVGV